MHGPDRARALAERYLAEVVEGLDLCPWTKAARAEGRVALEVIGGGEDAAACAARVASLAGDAALDAVLLVFDLAPGDAREAPRAFEAFLRDFRARYAATGADAMYAVMFHPALEEKARPSTADSLVAVIRRAPLPMIQCLRASVMDAVRRQAQRAAQARVAGGVLTDPQLSEEVAARNFRAHGAGAGRETLEARLAEARSADR